MSIPCPRCKGGEGWSPHFRCIECGDTGYVRSAPCPECDLGINACTCELDEAPEPGALGRHIKKAAAEVDEWPKWLRPVLFEGANKEVDR